MEVRNSRLQSCYNAFAWHWMDSNKISPRSNFVDSFWILQAHSVANISKLSVSKGIEWAHIRSISENYLGESLYITLEDLEMTKISKSSQAKSCISVQKSSMFCRLEERKHLLDYRFKDILIIHDIIYFNQLQISLSSNVTEKQSNSFLSLTDRPVL